MKWSCIGRRGGVKRSVTITPRYVVVNVAWVMEKDEVVERAHSRWNAGLNIHTKLWRTCEDAPFLLQNAESSLHNIAR